MYEENITLGEFRKLPNKEEYEIWDEETQQWCSYQGSCYTSSGEFPNPMIAKDAINVITIYDTLSQTYYSWGLKKDYQAESNVVYTKCNTEYDLIKKFIEFWGKDYPDIVSGWNTENFDIPYLINRANNVLGEEYVKMFSPVGQVYSKENVVKRFGKTDSKWYIKGVSLLDYMEVYKVFSRSPRESYALNAIGEVELGEGKLSYNATSLSKLADENWQLFVDYNIQDVTLLIKLEEKLKFLELSRMLSYLGLTQFESSLGTITVVTGAVACKALERNLIIPTFSTSDKAEYAGGYVKDPDRGLKEDIISFDANSLYPNTIITLNISPETKLGKIIDRENDEITIQLVNGKQYKLSQDKLLAFIEKEKICLSKAGILFTQKSKGIYPEIIEGIYQDRVKNKKDLTQHKKDIKHCKEGSEKYIEHKKMINHLDINQYTLKILLNRMYGTFANKHSPFCDIDLASSITLTGQACIKQASDIVDNHAKEKYGITRSLSTYSDTDSVYFTIQPILQSINKQLVNDQGKVCKEAYDIVQQIQDMLNAEISNWAKTELKSINPRFEFKRETICDVGIFIQKKRYILHVLDDEGVEENKTKYVGVEVVSTSTPKKAKPLIKNVVETMLKTKSYKKTNDAYLQAYESFKTLPIEDIAFPRGIKGYEKYASLAKDFSTAKGTPIHVKSAIYFNQLLDKLQLSGKYEKIKSGMKIKFFYTEPNIYNIESLAFIDKFPQEFSNIKINNDKMFEKIVTSAVQRLYDAVNWQLQKPNSQSVNNLFDLLG